jgi:hypothetical protein
MILVVSHLAVQLVKRTIGRPRLSRVVLGVHFPGDVLSGQLIAILTAVPFILV